MKNLFLCGSLFFSINTFAAEADHYTQRNEFLADISKEINIASNGSLQIAVIAANKFGDCNSKDSEKNLYKELKKYFGNHSNGKIVKDILHSEDIPKRIIPLKQSIFGEWSVLNGYLLGKKSAASSPLALSPTIKVGDQLIGIDKLEHMFGMGYIYFKRHYIKGHKLRRTLKNGIFREKTALGGNMLATGVFAYADLAANFNGMRFWNHVLQKRNDVLGEAENFGPYIKCENSKYIVNTENPIDLRKYVDESMDESINCSKFATKSGVRKYKRAIDKRGFSCPMSQETLDKMNEKYNVIIETDRKKRPISHWILNNVGLDDVSYFNEF